MRSLWVFQLFEPLTAEQEAKVSGFLNQFLSEWKAHGTPVPAGHDIRHERFVIVQAQEDAASGCSVDKMFREVLGMLQTLGAKVSGPENIFFKTETDEFGYFHFLEAEKHIREKRIHPETVIFNAALSDAAEIENFEIPLKDSWLGRFLVNPA